MGGIRNTATMENLGGGIGPKLFAKGLEKVLESIADAGTSAVKERKIVMTFTFKADEERQGVSVKVGMDAKLVQVAEKSAIAFLSKDGEGDLHMTTSDPKQMELADQLIELQDKNLEKAGNQ